VRERLVSQCRLRCDSQQFSNDVIIFRHGNALICRRKSFPCTAEHRAPDPSENCALQFKGKFRRFGICSVSGTIGRSTFRFRGFATPAVVHYSFAFLVLFFRLLGAFILAQHKGVFRVAEGEST